MNEAEMAELFNRSNDEVFLEFLNTCGLTRPEIIRAVVEFRTKTKKPKPIEYAQPSLFGEDYLD